MTAEEWADRVKICVRQLAPDERPPHGVTDYPAQYRAIVEVIRDAVRAEREACVKIIRAAYYSDEVDTIYGADRVAATIRARADP